ncbi:hypothetical protein B0T16DRAFT_322483 [Cercophora newfieldiana]|uniref:Rhodopsin domain-containing protein n=1 Tax=Cercophora newfieldiana TaxID=92897 RepID=A0AA39YH80_9PEZI|nr:hypothetical protein B0T16DRAFT_322483 [Cercophora newfieldiana]
MPGPEKLSFLALVRNPAESYQTNIIVCAVLTWIIGVVFVALRFYTRKRLLRNVLGAEDWTILVALVFAGATCAGMIEPVYGLGKHILDVEPAAMAPMARAGWYTILWYMLSLLFTKISILLLYIRILSYQHARYAVYVILAIVILANGIWTLATVVTACLPLNAFWDRTIVDAWCRPLVWWYANTGLHIATDVLLYVLPLPVIVNLQIKLRQKIVLYAVFALGVCSISVVRLWDLLEERKRTDFTYDNVSISYLTVIEINAAIACACSMTLKPFCARFFPRLWGSRSVNSGQPQRSDLEAAVPFSPRHGPPTIGSQPTRAAMAVMRPASWVGVVLQGRGEGDSHLDLLDDGDDKLSIGSGSDAKRSVEVESQTTASVTDAELTSGGFGLVPTKPPAAHLV